MIALYRSTIVASVLGIVALGTESYASDRVYITQIPSTASLVYVRQAIELPDQRAARAAAARAQRAQQAQRIRASRQATSASTQEARASDVSMLELSPQDMPSLPAAHIAVD